MEDQPTCDAFLDGIQVFLGLDIFTQIEKMFLSFSTLFESPYFEFKRSSNGHFSEECASKKNQDVVKNENYHVLDFELVLKSY